MLNWIIALYGFLSVLMHGLVLSTQSLVVGGVVFLLVVASQTSNTTDLIRSSLERWIRGWALLLAVLEVLSVAFNLVILMRTGGFAFTEVVSANFVLAGLVAAASALAIASVASLGSQVQYTERFFASLRMTR